MTKNFRLRTHEIDKGVGLAHLPEKYLHKIEVAKSNAPAAVSSTYTLCAVFGSLRMNLFKTKNTSSVFLSLFQALR